MKIIIITIQLNINIMFAKSKSFEMKSLMPILDDRVFYI